MVEENKSKMRAEKAESYEKIIRILQTDIPGSKQVYPGLTRIKGISWSMSNALCNQMGIDKKKKVIELNEQEIAKINEFLAKPKVPGFMINRRRDLESGEDMHLVGSNLDLRKEFDIKRLKKIKSYRGLRHATGQPVRGQRTRGHFRSKGKSVGVIKKKGR